MCVGAGRCLELFDSLSLPSAALVNTALIRSQIDTWTKVARRAKVEVIG
jgi:hypothetical protein